MPAGTALNVRLIWDVPLQGAGRGLSPKHRDATYDWATGKYMDGQAELTFPHPRAGQNDNALRGPLVAVYTIGTGPLSQTARYPLQAYETSPGELDITVDPNPATVVAAQTLIDLITDADVASQDAQQKGAFAQAQGNYAQQQGDRVDAQLAGLPGVITQAAEQAASETTGLVTEVLQEWSDTKVDIAQAQADTLALTGITPAYISETAADPPAAPADGTKGSRLDEYGNRVRLEWQGGVWLQRGVPILSRDGQVFVDGRKFLATQAADNRANLQDAVDYVADELDGGQIVLPAGRFVFRGAAAWRSGVGLRGQGRGLTVLSAQGVFQSIIEQYGAGPVVGGPTAEATAVPLENVHFSDFEIDGTGYEHEVSSVAGKGFFILYMRRAVFERLYIHHTVGTGLGCDFLTESVIHAVTVEHCGRNWDGSNPGGQSGIGIGTGWKGVESVTVSNCHTNYNGNYGVFVETQEVDNQTMWPRGARIIGCYSQGNRIGFGNKGSGSTQWIGCEAYSNTQDGFTLNGYAVDDLLDGCVSENNGRHGLYIPNHLGTVQVTGGRYRKNAQTGIRADQQPAGRTLKGLQVTGARISSNGTQGVSLAGNISDWSLKTNTIVNNGQALTSGTRMGVLLGNTLTDGEIVGNRIGNTDGTTTQAEAVAGSSLNAIGLTVQGNTVNGNTGSISGLFNGLNGTNIRIDDNPGYNDQAVPDNLAAGASPWTYTAGKSREQLYLIGTGITVNIGGQNVTSNATSAQLVLPASKTVTITYTAMTAARRMRI
ncbi:hypothetical protein AMD26_006735 [Deinococcus sp. UR1]|nr:hypothetical protein AMD26_006735 [Deinococcus sp. UR1]